MSDCCSLEVYVRPQDVETAADKLDVMPEYVGEPEVDEHGGIRLVDVEANYGAYDSREEWAQAGGIFYGSHMAGSEYGAYVFAAIDGVQVECNADGAGTWPVARVGPDDIVDASDLHRARLYHAALRRVQEAFRLARDTAKVLP